MNTHVRDNLSYLKGSAGSTAFDSGAAFSASVLIDSASLLIENNNATCRIIWTRTDGTHPTGFGSDGLSTIRVMSNGASVANLAGALWLLNDTSNADMTAGLTINQGANDDQVLAFKSSDIAHGITSQLETDTYGDFAKYSATDGGLKVRGITESAVGINLRTYVTTGDTTKGTTGVGAIHLESYLKSGTNITNMTANSNLMAIYNGANTRFIFDADGDLHADAAVSASAYDAYNDAALLRRLDVEISDPATIIDGQFYDWMQYQRPDLERAKLVTFNDDGHHFVNYTRLVRAQNGAIWQGYERDKLLAQENAELRGEVAVLRGLVVEMQRQMTALTAGQPSGSAASP